MNKGYKLTGLTRIISITLVAWWLALVILSICDWDQSHFSSQKDQSRIGQSHD